MYDDLSALVGRTISALFISADQSILWFDTDAGPIVYEAEGDCCSESWFADIIGADWLKGTRVISTETLGLPDYNVKDGRGRQEEDEAYGYSLTTERGVATIVFRNSSNGYYGGCLTLLHREEGERPADFAEIIEHDWRA